MLLLVILHYITICYLWLLVWWLLLIILLMDIVGYSIGDYWFGFLMRLKFFQILEFTQLKPDAREPVLCFVGPPGVGKTSLASSIVGALGRRFIRLSLGGVKDEVDIRGHRKTYIGSMAGRLIEGIKVEVSSICSCNL
jgi:hypothetical protein